MLLFLPGGKVKRKFFKMLYQHVTNRIFWQKGLNGIIKISI
jgi:hypothetical protein